MKVEAIYYYRNADGEGVYTSDRVSANNNAFRCGSDVAVLEADTYKHIETFTPFKLETEGLVDRGFHSPNRGQS